MPTHANGLLKDLGKIVCDNTDATELLKRIYCKAEAHATEILELATLEQLLHLSWMIMSTLLGGVGLWVYIIGGFGIVPGYFLNFSLPPSEAG